MLLLNKYLRTQALLIVLVFLFKNNISQNLINNGSFENYTNIDCTYGGFDNGNPPYNHVVDNWIAISTPDYFSSTCTNTYTGVPKNLFGYSQSKNGIGYAGISFYQKGNETKEYIHQQLSSPLFGGTIYCISFFVSRSERSTYAVKNIEVYFSNSLPSMPNGYYIVATPQITKQNIFINDTVNWTQIQGCFTAIGGEQYMTIGNFNSNSNTDTLFIGTNNPIPFYGDFSYYYIDDITLIDQSTVGVNELGVSTKISMHPNPNNGSMILDYDLGNYSNAKVNLFDITGKIINSYKLSDTKGILQMNEQDLNNGVYFYSILVGEKTIKTDKIVIIK